MGQILYPDYFPNQCDYDGESRWVQSTLKGYMRMFWMVKKWRITITLTDHPTTPYDGSFDFVYQSNAGSEEELACPSGWGFYLIEHPSGRDSWEVEEFNILPYFSAANDYRPLIYLGYAASGDALDNGLGVGDGSGLEREGLTVNQKEVNITNFGSDTATITYHNFTQEGGNMQTEISALKAEEYWSYGD
jgi:hypothetical protein